MQLHKVVVARNGRLRLPPRCVTDLSTVACSAPRIPRLDRHILWTWRRSTSFCSKVLCTRGIGYQVTQVTPDGAPRFQSWAEDHLTSGVLLCRPTYVSRASSGRLDFFDGMTTTTINVKIEKNKPSTPHSNALRPLVPAMTAHTIAAMMLPIATKMPLIPRKMNPAASG